MTIAVVAYDVNGLRDSVIDGRNGLLIKEKNPESLAKPAELKDIIFAKGFGRITDLQVGPDDYLYVLLSGKIFRIIPRN